MSMNGLRPRIVRGDDAGIAVYGVAGNLFAPDVAHVLADNHRWLLAEPRPAQVVIYEQARMLIQPAAIFSAARTAAGSDNSGGLATPTALLVAPETLPMWRQYCYMMAEAGVLRGAFSDWSQARAWAAEQGALVAAQKRHRQRGR